MNSLAFSLFRLSGASARAGKATAAGLVFLLAGFAHGQDWQFGFDASGNLITQTAEISAPPQILGQPQPQVVGPGELASFFVLVADTRAISYQWRFNGIPLSGSGATNDALLLSNVGATNEGQYTVVLVNPSGSVTSAPALLLLDGDGDSLPDLWEQTNFSNLNQTATGDFDNDGVSNQDEFLDGTDPTDNASARFRLTILSDGGLVEAVPTRLSYTNGEMVTLTAIPFASGSFLGWTGDANTTSNPVALTMTTNRTVFAHFHSLDLVWTNLAGGDWHVASNWRFNFVPGSNDNVFITNSVTVTLNSDAAIGSLTLGSSVTAPTLTGSGSLTLQKSSSWSGGAMSGTGRTIILPGVTLNVNPASDLILNNRILENGGTVVWTGAGHIAMGSAIITNRPGALFDVRNANSFYYQSGAGSRFDNAGTFRKLVSTGTTTASGQVAFNNYGTVEIQTGTLALGGGGANTGSYDVSGGTTLNLLGGTHTSSGGSSIAGAGHLTVGAAAALAGLVNVSGTNRFSFGTVNLTGNYICTNNTLIISDGAPNFDGTGTVSPAVLNLSSGTLGGGNTVTVGSVMNWTGGTMSGGGQTIISSGATLNASAASDLFLSNRILENGGTAVWTGAGYIVMGSAIITNRPEALFEVRNAGAFFYQSGAGCRFDNAGTFRKSVSTGTTTASGQVAFNNYGTVEIRNGILAANGGYTSTAHALLNCAIGGTDPGTGYGRLQVAGAVTLNGALSVDFNNGFVPAVDASFTVLTAGTCSGTFASFYYPSNEFTMQMSNTVNSVIVRVTGTAVPLPMLLTPELSGTDIRLIWTAVSNTTYRLEFNPDLSPSNWNALPGDVTTLSNTASKLDALTSTNRFYRVRVVPE